MTKSFCWTPERSWPGQKAPWRPKGARRRTERLRGCDEVGSDPAATGFSCWMMDKYRIGRVLAWEWAVSPLKRGTPRWIPKSPDFALDTSMVLHYSVG